MCDIENSRKAKQQGNQLWIWYFLNQRGKRRCQNDSEYKMYLGNQSCGASTTEKPCAYIITGYKSLWGSGHRKSKLIAVHFLHLVWQTIPRLRRIYLHMYCKSQTNHLLLNFKSEVHANLLQTPLVPSELRREILTPQMIESPAKDSFLSEAL